MADIPASGLIPFGELMPDMGSYEAGGAIVAKNCLPYGQKYKPFETISEVTAALPTGCRGAFSYRDAAGTVTVFAGTATKLYKLSGTTWTDVTRAVGGNYGLGADDFWRFVPFGNLIIATNYVDDIQCFNITSSTNFALMSATAPRCRDFAVIANFLVCIDTVDGDGAVGFRARWSPIADPQGVWGSVPATQTDYQDIYDTVYSNSYITDFGEFGVVVQGRSMYRMDYVGGDDIFTFHKIVKGQGSLLTRGNVYNGASIFLRCEDGFYEFNGGQMLPIGDKKIDAYFSTNFNEAYDYNLNCNIDPIRKLVMWSVPHTDATGGLPNKLYVFNWIDRRWTIIDQECEFLFSFISTGYTLEDLDAISASLDALPFSLDSRAWTGGKTVLGAFTSTHKLGLFTGTAMTATLQTSEVRLNPSGRAVLDSITPYIEGGTVTGRLGTRNLLSESITWTASASANPYTGALDFTTDATFFTSEVTVSGSWTIATGISIKSQESAAA